MGQKPSDECRPGGTRFNRNEFTMAETDHRLIAALAIIGLVRHANTR